MDWYEPYNLCKSIKSIRKFLIDVASLEHEIDLYGLYVTRKLDGFEVAINEMDEFPEKFTAIKRKVSLLDKELFSQLDLLEKESHLVEQISLINLKIQMSQRSRRSALVVPFARAFLAMPRILSASSKHDMFAGESISIERIIVNCDRLNSILKIVEEILRHREESDDILFKPSNIKESRVIDLIDQAIEQVENSDSLAHDIKEKLTAYLYEAKTEVISSSPKWSKIVGALVIAAAITSGLADAPEAAKTLQSVVEYILGSSVRKPLHNYLPLPDQTHDQEPNLVEA